MRTIEENFKSMEKDFNEIYSLYHEKLEEIIQLKNELLRKQQ